MNFKKLFGNIDVFRGLKIAGFIFVPYFFKNFIYKVEPGYQAIKFDILSGLNDVVVREGYHIRIPYIQRPIIFDCRMKKSVFTSKIGTKDLQVVDLKISLVCRPDVANLPDLYRILGLNYDNVLFSIVYEIAGSVISQYNVAQLINQRDIISFLIKQKIHQKGKEFFIEIDDVALMDITFSPEFSAAIEKKQVAQQEAERMKFLVEMALEDKKSTIIKAMGEAESVKKFGEANKIGSAFLELRKIETAKYISSILKDSVNKVVLDANSLYMNLPPIDDSKIANKEKLE